MIIYDLLQTQSELTNERWEVTAQRNKTETAQAEEIRKTLVRTTANLKQTTSTLRKIEIQMNSATETRNELNATIAELETQLINATSEKQRMVNTIETLTSDNTTLKVKHEI